MKVKPNRNAAMRKRGAHDSETQAVLVVATEDGIISIISDEKDVLDRAHRIRKGEHCQQLLQGLLNNTASHVKGHAPKALTEWVYKGYEITRSS
jgi:hypothetical protein